MTDITSDETVTPVVNAAKYDRQLRLWGDQGQKCLEKAQVCLINATTVGTETLKNLILPGIGSFTVIDSNLVTARDLGNNFFVTRDDVGKPRASVVCENLQELNPDVRGIAIEESLDCILEKTSDFFIDYSIVLACLPLSESALKRLAESLWHRNIPLIIPRVCGFWACIRMVFKSHYVIEAHPEAVIHDLRLDKLDHIPGLREFADSQDLDTMRREKHSHTPYLILLIKFLDQWYINEGCTEMPEMPLKYKDKKRFQELLAAGVKTKDADSEGPEDEENFNEASKAVNTAFIRTTVPQNVQNLFEHEACLNISAESPDFWIIVRAIKQYVVSEEGKGCLPLSGTIPDMTSDSERYIKLQSLYQEAAKTASTHVAKHVGEILRSIGRSQDSISFAEIRRYCKNAPGLEMINTSSLKVEFENADVQCNVANRLLKFLPMAGENDPTNLFNIYLLFLASDEFYSLNQRYPGDCDSKNCESDVLQLKQCISNVVSRLNGSSSPSHFSMPNDLVTEMVRFGGASLHVTGSYLGGVASQEVIKLLTSQYVPFADLYVWDGISCTSESFKF